MPVDHTNDLVLITCAGGKQAGSLLEVISGRWTRLRLAAHSDVSAQRLRKEYPDADVVQPNLTSADEVRDLLRGVSIVYHIGPTLHPKETQMGINMIDAALAESYSGSFKHFIYSSVFPTQLRKLMNHDCKRYVEEHLIESGLNFTVLQPSHMFDNTKIAQLMEQQRPVHPMAYSADIKFSFTALKDLSDAAAVVMDQREKHYFAVYPIISTMPIAYRDFIQAMERAIDKPIEIKQMPFEDAVNGFQKMLAPDSEIDPGQADAAERLLLYYSRRGLWGNPTVTEWLLGRKTIGCDEWARSEVQKVKQS